MAIMIRCPSCSSRNKLSRKKCNCGVLFDSFRKNKKISYVVVYRVGGSQKCSSFKSLNDARLAEAEILRAKRNGFLQDLVSKKEMTFNDVATWYFELPLVKNISYLKDLKLYSNHFLNEFGHYNVMALKSENIESFQYQKKSKGHADSYIDKMVSSVQAMVKKAVFNELIPTRALVPFENIKKLLRKNSNARNRVLSRTEYDLIYNNLADHLKPIFATAYWTGMRKNEILTLTWDRVSLDQKLILLRKQDTKDKEERLISIPDPLLEILSNLDQLEGYVFIFRSKPIHDIRTGLKLACRKAGVRYGQRVEGGFIFHDLRHTFNTNARKAGIPESVIMKMTGHSTREMFDRYNTVDITDLTNASVQLVQSLEVLQRNK